MKLAVEFPSVAYREGSGGVIKLAQAIEAIGYDQLDMFDHVVMGHPTQSRPAARYPASMPIMEALITLSHVAAVTSSIGLGTEVLVLPQRQPALVAKQVSTLDTLSGGRMRLGVGSGWQESEFAALGEDFSNRGQRLDDAIALLREYWSEPSISFAGPHYPTDAMGMEPKPPQGAQLPIWVGGAAPAALRRAGRVGDGWLGTSALPSSKVPAAIATIREAAEAAGRDPDALGLQMMLDAPPRSDDTAGKAFYADHDRVVARASEIQGQGFDWITLNVTAMFQSGARSVAAMIDVLGTLHERIRIVTG